MRRSLPLLFCLLACNENEPQLYQRTQVDVFQQEIRRKVDILLVVDNSCSMIDEQQKLAGNFDNFIAQFLEAEVDYQIGVVTTDMENPEQAGKLQGDTKIIASSMPVDEARALFQENVKVCATGSGFEMGLAAAAAAFTDADAIAHNAGFLRDDASLSVVFVSDEEDDSPRPVDHYLDQLKGLKGAAGYRDDGLINLSSVVGDPPSGCEQPTPYVPDCTDGLDEVDADGVIDCLDDECATSRWCTIVGQRELDCADGGDGDNDGLTDCDDADCGAEGFCRESDCEDGIDNDRDYDGVDAADCLDLDCLLDRPDLCGELQCDDGDLRHHGDNPFPNLLLDCADPSCFAVEETAEQCFADRAALEYRERCDLTVQFDPWSGFASSEDGPDIDSVVSLDLESAGCVDSDCASYWLCAPALRSEGWGQCGNCLDDDLDGAEDCEDNDCLESPYCDNPYAIEPANRYIDASVRTGGIVTSICAEEFSGIVRELGLNISGLRTVYYLTAWPDIDTIVVRFNDAQSAPIAEGWTFEAETNRVLFTDAAAPPAGTTVYITYTRHPNPPSEQVSGGAR